MKTKYISILLFVLAFAGVALLGYTPARADWDRTCTSTADGECIKVEPWTIKAFVGFDDDGEEITVELGGNWPILQNDRSIFRYITGVTLPGTKVSAQSYTVFQWPVIPSGGDPSGAQANLDALFIDCDATIQADKVYWKLNRIANDKKDGIIDIYMPLGTGVDTECGNVWIKWAKECGGGTIWVAQGGGIPVQITAGFPDCGPGNSVEVTFDKCTGYPEDVLCANGFATEDPNAVICDSNVVNDDCIYAPNFGPLAGGSVICTDPPVFVYGESMWFCPE